MSRTFRRLTAVMILALLAGAGAAQALPAAKARGPERIRFEDPFLKTWHWILGIFEKAEHSTFIDPNGHSLIADPGVPTQPANGATVGSIDEN